MKKGNTMKTNELHYFKLKKTLIDTLTYNCAISKVFCGFIENLNYESNQIFIRINSPSNLFVIVPITDIEYMAPAQLVYSSKNEQTKEKEKDR